MPAEAIESVSPVIMHKRALIPDSGGAGTFRGGLGQEMVLSIDSDHPALHSCMYDRTHYAPRGFLGGRDGGAANSFCRMAHACRPRVVTNSNPGKA